MKTIEIHVSIGLVGCRRTTTIEVEDDATDDEIEEVARESMFELVEWSWRVKTPKIQTKSRR